MEIEKIVFDDSAGRVENRNNVEVCVFMTQSGKEVLFFRDKNDNVVKSFEGKLDSAGFVKARGMAGLSLQKKFLRKETNFTTKVVTVPQRAQAADRAKNPVWLQRRLAVKHAGQISPHTDDD